MISTVLQVALGGAIGASARYLTGVAMFKALGPVAFPMGVITVNILGSALMGVFAVLAAMRGLTGWAPFAMTGILGGFTTFSAFSLEAVTLYQRGEVVSAGLYVGLSVVVSILALIAGMWVARGVVA